MTLFFYINENIDRIKYEVKNGLIPCATIKHWYIYSRFDYYKKLGNSKENAVIYVCNEFQAARSWIFIIVKKMEREMK